MTHRIALVALVAACGDTATTTPPPGSLQNLIEAEWTLPSNTESYLCAFKTVTEDIYVGEFVPVIPLGTHHTVLTMGEPTRPDGIEECSAGTNNPNMIFGSGVGTGTFTFPPGVAVKIPAGKQLAINFHLFNATDAPLSGRSGTDVRVVDEAEVELEAEAVLAGPIQLDIPPGVSTTTGKCTLAADETLFAAGAHMHTLGRHMKVTAMPAGGAPQVVFDRDYSFDSQVVTQIDPLALRAGDAVEVACTYENPGTSTVHFGESTLDEMCFSGLYWYPARKTTLFCVQ